MIDLLKMNEIKSNLVSCLPLLNFPLMKTHRLYQFMRDSYTSMLIGKTSNLSMSNLYDSQFLNNLDILFAMDKVGHMTSQYFLIMHCRKSLIEISFVLVQHMTEIYDENILCQY